MRRGPRIECRERDVYPRSPKLSPEEETQGHSIVPQKLCSVQLIGCTQPSGGKEDLVDRILTTIENFQKEWQAVPCATQRAREIMGCLN